MASPKLHELCDARLPVVQFDEAKSDISHNVCRALLSLARAAAIVGEDTDLFRRKLETFDREPGSANPQHQVDNGTTISNTDIDTPVAVPALKETFVRGVAHHITILLKPTFNLYKERLEAKRLLSRQVEAVLVHGRNPTVGELLDFVKSHLDSAEAKFSSLESLVVSLDELLPVSVGDKVPTASPRQALVRFLLQGSEFQEEIKSESGREEILGNIRERLALPKVTFQEWRLKRKDRKIRDGTPTVLFMCFSGSSKADEPVVDASQEDWYDVPAIRQVRRRDRDHRLSEYIHLSKNAYEKLLKFERDFEAPIDLPGSEGKYDKRKRAIKAMRGNEHFLNGTHILGQAFDSRSERQCCYPCQGMIGFRSPKSWTEKERKDVIISFCVDNTNGYSHACAEVDALFQIQDLEQKHPHTS